MSALAGRSRLIPCYLCRISRFLLGRVAVIPDPPVILQLICSAIQVGAAEVPVGELLRQAQEFLRQLQPRRDFRDRVSNLDWVLSGLHDKIGVSPQEPCDTLHLDGDQGPVLHPEQRFLADVLADAEFPPRFIAIRPERPGNDVPRLYP